MTASLASSLSVQSAGLLSGDGERGDAGVVVWPGGRGRGPGRDHAAAERHGRAGEAGGALVTGRSLPLSGEKPDARTAGAIGAFRKTPDQVQNAFPTPTGKGAWLGFRATLARALWGSARTSPLPTATAGLQALASKVVAGHSWPSCSELWAPGEGKRLVRLEAEGVRKWG